MVFVKSAAKVLLHAARAGELEQLKRSAAAIDDVLGDGIQAIVDNTKDDEGKRAIHHAAAGGRVDVLKYLIEDMTVDVDVKDGKGKIPLSCACIEGRLAAVEYLLDMGANPEIPEDLNTYPLHLAAMNGHNDIIPLLLSKGINVDVMERFGSPLQCAAIFGRHDTVKLLLDHGANPNLVFLNMFSPLNTSVRSQSWECTQHLLKAGADPNGGPDGIKVLTLAVELGGTQIIKLLVEAGADPNITDIRGLKPIEVAAVNGNRRGVEILFPVTSLIPSYNDWSVNGIMKHVNSDKFDKEFIHKTKENFLEAKSRGTSAFQRKEYWRAVYWYTEALQLKPGDAAVLSNRSLCNVYINKGDCAYEDAKQCMLARPDWPKAYYRAGAALKLLNRLDEAAVAFSDGLKLDPGNKELQDALREVSFNS